MDVTAWQMAPAVVTGSRLNRQLDSFTRSATPASWPQSPLCYHHRRIFEIRTDVIMTSNNSILSDAQRDLLGAALNRIVPPAGEMPGAGDLGIASFVESVAAGSTGKRRLLVEGLVQIELAASERGGTFNALSSDAQRDALQAVESSSPQFFQELVTQAYRGYYTNATVCSALGYRPPNRVDYDPLPFDESLLEPVRQRGQVWTETG